MTYDCSLSIDYRPSFTQTYADKAEAHVHYFLGFLHTAIHLAAPLVKQYGLWMVVVALFLENLGVIFIPGESILVAAGFLAAKALFSIWLVMGLAIFFATIGGYVSFGLGTRYGHEGMLRWGRWAGVTEARLDKTHTFFVRFVPLVVLVGRFFVPLRQLQGYVAGAAQMDKRTFGVWSFLGAVLWVSVWGGGAYWLGSQ